MTASTDGTQADPGSRRHRQDRPPGRGAARRRAACRHGSARAPASRRFDWEDRATWAPALDGVGSVYVSYYPDIAVPGRRGDGRHVRRAGRAERRPSARAAVRPRRARGRAGRAGRARLRRRADDPAVDVVQPELQRGLHAGARAQRRGPRCPPGTRPSRSSTPATSPTSRLPALTDDRHVGQLYELTGPRSLTFADAAAEIREAAGRPIRLRAGLDRRARGRGRRARRAGRGHRAAHLPVRRRSSTAATPTSPTASSARSAASRATSRLRARGRRHRRGEPPPAGGVA